MFITALALLATTPSHAADVCSGGPVVNPLAIQARHHSAGLSAILADVPEGSTREHDFILATVDYGKTVGVGTRLNLWDNDGPTQKEIDEALYDFYSFTLDLAFSPTMVDDMALRPELSKHLKNILATPHAVDTRSGPQRWLDGVEARVVELDRTSLCKFDGMEQQVALITSAVLVDSARFWTQGGSSYPPSYSESGEGGGEGGDGNVGDIVEGDAAGGLAGAALGGAIVGGAGTAAGGIIGGLIGGPEGGALGAAIGGGAGAAAGGVLWGAVGAAVVSGYTWATGGERGEGGEGGVGGEGAGGAETQTPNGN